VPVVGLIVFNGQNQNEQRIENIMRQIKVNLIAFRRVQILLERKGISERIRRSMAIPVAIYVLTARLTF
jgi:hypothetical protein